MAVSTSPQAAPRAGPVKSLVRALLHSTAFYAFVVVWLICAGVLLLRGHLGLLAGAGGVLILVGVLGAVTVALTPEPPAEAEEGPATPRRLLWLQVAVLLLTVFLTGWDGLAFHGVVSGRVPLWSDLGLWLIRIGHMTPSPTWVSNPVHYVLIPGTLLLLMGVPLRQMGFRRGVRSWVALLPWVVLLVASTAIRVAMDGGMVALTRLPLRMVSHFFNNGPMEEFLFRGALMGRLTRLWGSGWALLLSSWLFGAWHLGLTTAGLQGDLAAGLALAILVQGSMGLLFGLVAQRTRSLLAPSLAHILQNSL